MKKILPKNLISVANLFSKPLFVVGGAVRNYLIDGSLSNDIDLAGAIDAEQFAQELKSIGIDNVSVYKRTGTVMFSDENYRYEYTAFRREKYIGGEHTPFFTEFCDDIHEDALRRDFKCNAVYYDIKKGEIVDLLGGVSDIKNKILDTVCEPDIVFSSDGLRLLRLARFVGELNFNPTDKVIQFAKKHAENILDISPERIFSEIKMILVSDKKYSFSDKTGHYRALKILDKTRVLDRIFPELTAGREMAQRADFHKYDVLEHSLRTVLYSPPKMRLSALLHDVGKPFCFLRDGVYHNHGIEGEEIAEKILIRLKADKKTISDVKFFVKEHMLDLNGSLKENKLRRFIIKNQDRIEGLLSLKQADFRASLEKDEIAPTLIKWNKVIEQMKQDGTPFSLKDLKISSKDLMELGYKNQEIGKQLNELFDYAILNPKHNNYDKLIAFAKKHLNK